MNLRLFHRLLSLFRPHQLDRDLSQEISAHIDLAAEENLKSGMSPQEARRRALLQFGSLPQALESARDQRSLPLLESLLQDARFSLRLFRKSPGFTAMAIFTLALGIGANTATFSCSNTFLRNPISFPQVDRLFMVMNQAPGDTEGSGEVTPADFLDIQSQNHSFEGLAAYNWADLNLTGVGGPVKVQGFRVTANFFDVLRATPLLGRSFVQGEDQPGGDSEVILSSGLWRRQFASDPNIVGRTVHLDGTPVRIVGVMNDAVRFPISAEVWVPLPFSPRERTDRTSHSLSPVARLKPGIPLAQAQAEMNSIQDRLRASFPKSESGWSVQLVSIGDFVVGPGRGYMLLTLCAVGFALLIACTNVMNLLLARSSVRQGEYAIRVALGATPSRLIRQALVESVLLAMGALGVGLLIGYVWISLIRSSMPPEVARFVPGWDQVRLDRGVFLYTFAVALAAGLVAGILPAFFGARANPNIALKESGRGPGSGVSRARLRSAFVIAEIALSLVLLVAAGLMVKGVNALLDLNFKFEPHSVLTFRVALPASRYDTPQKRLAFFDDLTNRLNRISGVSSSAASLQVPFSGGDSGDFSLEHQPPQPGEYRTAEFNNVDSSFFHLLHVPLIEGREFNEQDSLDSAPVAIVSQSFANRFWPGRTALGHRIKAGDENTSAPFATIVGVVSEVTYNPWRHTPLPAIYFPFRQHPESNACVSLHASSSISALIPALRPAVQSIDPDQPIYDVQSLDRLASNQLLGLSRVAALLGAVGVMALVLSAVGVSGVMAFAVAQRKHETGVRLALGATPSDVLRLFVFSGLKLLALGLIIGLPMAFALARLLSSLLFGVSSHDFVSFLGCTLLLASAVVLACYIPARAAARVDPINALRYE